MTAPGSRRRWCRPGIERTLAVAAALRSAVKAEAPLLGTDHRVDVGRKGRVDQRCSSERITWGLASGRASQAGPQSRRYVEQSPWPHQVG